MPVFNAARQQQRRDLIELLRTLTPEIEQAAYRLHHLIHAYNRALDDARDLQDHALDDLEAAEYDGRSSDAMRFARHLWASQDFADLADYEMPRLNDAERLERLPVDV